MVGSTYKAFGASTSVSIGITATPLDQPAIITSPVDQARYPVADITVSGTCPNNSYVKIYKSGIFGGVAPCENGKFELAISLRNGANILQVKVFNYSNVEGPASDSITVYYDTPPTATIPASTTTPTSNAAIKPRFGTEAVQTTDPLRIITDYQYKVHISGQPTVLDLALTGGTAPFAFAVDWNDGKITPIPRPDNSVFQTSHTYPQKPRLHTYVIKVAVSDLDGNSDYIQLMAAVDRPASEEASEVGAAPVQGNKPNNSLPMWLKYLWPAYLMVVLMVFCFYLGEREERRILMRKIHKTL